MFPLFGILAFDEVEPCFLYTRPHGNLSIGVHVAPKTILPFFGRERINLRERLTEALEVFLLRFALVDLSKLDDTVLTRSGERFVLASPKRENP